MTPRAETNPRRRCFLRINGFTLTELTVLVVVLAVISVFAAAALTNLGATRQAAAAARLARDLQLARQRSVSQGVRTWVVLDGAAQQYALFVEDVAAPGRTRRVPMIDDATGRAMVVRFGRAEWRGAAIESISVGGGSEVGFDTRGRPIAVDERPLSDDATITISGGHVIRITARTGMIQRVQ